MEVEVFPSSQSDSQGKYVFESPTDFERRFPNDLQIQRVTNKTDFKIFYHVPFQVYHDDPSGFLLFGMK